MCGLAAIHQDEMGSSFDRDTHFSQGGDISNLTISAFLADLPGREWANTWNFDEFLVFSCVDLDRAAG